MNPLWAVLLVLLSGLVCLVQIRFIRSFGAYSAANRAESIKTREAIGIYTEHVLHSHETQKIMAAAQIKMLAEIQLQRRDAQKEVA